MLPEPLDEVAVSVEADVVFRVEATGLFVAADGVASALSRSELFKRDDVAIEDTDMVRPLHEFGAGLTIDH